MQLPLGLGIADTKGLLALSSLALLLLLYFTRPRLRQLEVPSLMFFLNSKAASRLFAFLQRFLHDPLLILQALAIAALALVLAQPYIITSKITTGHAAIVLDASASMQALDGGTTLFSQAVERAKERLGRRTSIILAKDEPVIAARDAGQLQARSFLNKAKPAATASHIGEAMILAADTLPGTGRVVVISDFRNTGGITPDAARKALEAKGIQVEFVPIGASRENAGFIDLAIDEAGARAFLRNFGPAAREFSILVAGQRQARTVGPRATEAIPFQPGPGLTRLELETPDALALDNTLLAGMPSREPVRALLITNNASVYLVNALKASGEVTLDIAEPPVVTPGEHDVIIFHRIDPGKLLPGTMRDLASKARKGADAVILAWPNLSLIDFEGLLPVALDGTGSGGTVQVLQRTRYTRDMDFGMLREHFRARPTGDALTLAAIGNDTIIASAPAGDGQAIYVGLPEESGDIAFSTTYPIFWLELLRELAGRSSIEDLNARTGQTLILDQEADIIKPDGTRETAAAVELDQAGTYQLPGRQVAVNLLDARESDTTSPLPEGAAGAASLGDAVPQQRPVNLELIILGGILLLIELFILKRRGDA
jgi:hypothetical protein